MIVSIVCIINIYIDLANQFRYIDLEIKVNNSYLYFVTNILNLNRFYKIFFYNKNTLIKFFSTVFA